MLRIVLLSLLLSSLPKQDLAADAAYVADETALLQTSVHNLKRTHEDAAPGRRKAELEQLKLFPFLDDIQLLANDNQEADGTEADDNKGTEGTISQYIQPPSEADDDKEAEDTKMLVDAKNATTDKKTPKNATTSGERTNNSTDRQTKSSTNKAAKNSTSASKKHAWENGKKPPEPEELEEHKPTTPWHLVKLDLWKFPLAMCLDGSPGSFYMQSSSSKRAQNKWVIHHEGGTWCALDVPSRLKGWKQVDHCLQRTSGALGTSTQNKPTPYDNRHIMETINNGELTANATTNPLMHDWNHVHVNYCDGGSFSGRNTTSQIVKACINNDTCSSKELHFKGNFVLEAVIQTLLEEHGLDKAKEAVLAGCGAGGLATYLHADKWHAALPEETFVVALVDSGFFLDWSMTTPEGEPRQFGRQLRSVFNLHNASGAMAWKCAENQNSLQEPLSDCFFPEHGSNFISVPVFARQSMVDTYQLSAELGCDFNKDDTPMLEQSINAYRKYLALAMNTSLLSQHQNGAFVSNCQYHCGHWNDLAIGGMDMSRAFSKWYSERYKAWERGMPASHPSMRLWQDREWSCPDC